VLTVVAADGMPITEKRIEYALAVGSRQGQFGNENSVAVDHGGKVTLLPPAWMTANGPADLSHIVLSLRSETSGCVQTRFEKWPFEPVRMQLAPGLSLHGRVLQFDGTPARFADV